MTRSKNVGTESEQSKRGQTEAAMTETNPPPNKQKPHIHISTEVGRNGRGHTTVHRNEKKKGNPTIRVGAHNREFIYKQHIFPVLR